MLHTSTKFKSKAKVSPSFIKEFFYSRSFIIYSILQITFMLLEFGTVFFILALFFMIYKNTSNGEKDGNTLSAYSVFNKGGESIDGTLSGEQLDKEFYRKMY